MEGTVFDLVAKGLGEEANLIRKYNEATQCLSLEPENSSNRKVDDLQSELDQTMGGHSIIELPLLSIG